MVETILGSARASNIEYAIRDVVVPAIELEKKGHSIIRLNIGDPLAFDGLKTPKNMIDAYTEALKMQRNGYGPSYGIPELRKAIAESEKEKGWDCSEDDVYITHGVTEALQIIFAAFLEPGDKVLAPGPHYPPYLAYPQMFGASTVEYRLNSDQGWKIDIDDVKSKMDEDVKLLVLINPNNPTGNVSSAEQVSELIKLASSYPKCTIISDEIYDGLDFSNSFTSTASISQHSPVITLNGVSKVFFAPGWRIGYMAWHDPKNQLSHVRDGVERLLRSRLCASSPAQYGYLAGLKGSKKNLEDNYSRILGRLEYSMKRISEIKGIECHRPGGAFYLFVKITDSLYSSDDKKFVLDLLHKKHVLVVHGSGFSPEFGKGHFRMVCLPSVEVLKEAFNRIDEFLNSHK